MKNVQTYLARTHTKPPASTVATTTQLPSKATTKPPTLNASTFKENMAHNAVGSTRTGQTAKGTLARQAVEPKIQPRKEQAIQSETGVSREVKKPVRPMSSKVASSQASRQAMVVQQDLHECKDCGRKFNEKTIARHEKICKKVFGQKRKVFNSAKQRIVSKEQVQILKKTQGKQNQTTITTTAALPKWKQDSLAFRMAMKQAKGIAPSPEEARVAQQAREAASGLKLCKFCNRRFNEVVADRHIPFCEKKLKEANIRKPGRR